MNNQQVQVVGEELVTIGAPSTDSLRHAQLMTNQTGGVASVVGSDRALLSAGAYQWSMYNDGLLQLPVVDTLLLNKGESMQGARILFQWMRNATQYQTEMYYDFQDNEWKPSSWVGLPAVSNDTDITTLELRVGDWARCAADNEWGYPLNHIIEIE